jgi:hypothetical protein
MNTNVAIMRPGDRVKDKISGTKGIVVARTEWLYGCVRVSIQPEETKDGKPAESFVIDEAQCEVVKRNAVADTRAQAQVADQPAGDRPDAGARAQEPRR